MRHKPLSFKGLAVALLLVLFLGILGCGTAAGPPETSSPAAATSAPERTPAENLRSAPSSVAGGAGDPAGVPALQTGEEHTPAPSGDRENTTAPGGQRAAGGPKVTLWVTRDFGRETLFAAEVPLPPGSDVLSLLKNHTRVETAYGGKFVNAINGIRSDGRGGRLDWFYWVNGVLAPVGAADFRPDPGDVVWWDYRDWSAGPPAPAVVGAYPCPLKGGAPVLILYPEGQSDLFRQVAGALATQGIQACGSIVDDRAVLQRNTPVLVVGLWRDLASSALAKIVERGARSGIYCRLTADGFTALDERGNATVDLKESCGTVLATAAGPGDRNPLWIVTATDDAGLKAAVRVLEDPSKLRCRCGVLVQESQVTALPAGGAAR
ncbi:MAG: DUF4430 domain-containing protein [Bacillota bacterium]